ncbi:MAG: CAP domain-containing protein [Planctomycetes bacterium]|nr:CAP domain-containing protein [Planctomycetota bacterium]
MRALALLLTASLVGQTPTTPPPEPPTLPVLLRMLRDDAFDAVERDALADQILARDLPARTALFDAVRTGYAARHRQFRAAVSRQQKRFAKEVPATLKSQLGRQATRKLDSLRTEALALSRSAELSKAMIHDQIDPLLQQIEALALVTPAAVLAHDRQLADADRALRELATRATEWFRLYLRIMHEVDRDEAGRRHIDRFEQEPEPPESARELDEPYALAALTALPLSGRDQQALLANVALQPQTDPEEFAGTMHLNRIRIALGLNVVAIDDKLGHAARDHSVDMRTLGFFSHESPVAGKRTFGDRAAKAGTSASAENIAWGQATGIGAITAWWYSPGHHKNMLGGHARTGLGRSESHWTQMFGG